MSAPELDGAESNRFGPELRTHDRFGNRIDEVVFDPTWHLLMASAMREGEHCSPWAEPRAGAQVARAAAYLMHAEVENGTQCPLTMTYAALPVLRRHQHALPWLAQLWVPQMLARDYDPRALPLADKISALIGMGMTERQGGSDVRQYDSRKPGGRRRVPPHGPQVVFLGADVRCAPGAGNRRLDAHVAALMVALADVDGGDRGVADNGESGARRLAGGVAVALAGALMVRHASPALADAYCASRLDRFGSGALGALPLSAECAEIIAQASA